MKNRPNFFIIGAPKCGTTALAHYLNEHQQVFITDPKEPHFFATDLENYRVAKSMEQYEALFADVTGESAVGEASVFYLYSREALANIRDFNPDAKIIVMLRNPVDMIPSLHGQLVYSADENILDFEEAWYASGDRERGEGGTKHTREIALLNYMEMAKYAQQLQRVREWFPESQIKIIFFEDFIKDTEQCYIEVLEFLSLKYDGKKEFPIINEHTETKNTFLNTLLKRPPSFLVAIWIAAKRVLGVRKRVRVIQKLVDINTVKTKRKPLTETLKKEIREHYGDEVRSLAAMTGRDLDHWIGEARR